MSRKNALVTGVNIAAAIAHVERARANQVSAPLVTAHDDDLPPLRFTSCVHAFAWAESTLGRPSYGGMFRALLKPSGRSDYSKEEILDLAHTISASARDMVPYNGRELFMVLFCASVRDYEPERYAAIVDVLAGHLRTGPAEAVRKRKQHQLDLVADFTVANLFREAAGKKPIPKSSLADALEIKKQSLRDGGWPELMRYAHESAMSWLDRAKEDLTVKLQLRGIVV